MPLLTGAKLPSGTRKFQRQRSHMPKELLKDEEPSHGLPTSERIEACQKDWRKALKILESQNSIVTLACVNATLRVLSRTGQWQRSLSLLTEIKQGKFTGVTVSHLSLTLAMVACGNAPTPRWETTIDLLTQSERQALQDQISMKLRTRAFNTAINVCNKGGRSDKALELLADMETAGVPGDGFTLTIALTAYGNLGLWRRALQVMEYYQSEGNRPSIYSYGAAIQACGKDGRWVEALELLDIVLMSDRDIEPNAFVFSAAISACANGNQYKKAIEVFYQMEPAGVKPDRVCYNAAITSCARSGKWDLATGLLDEMTAVHGIEADEYTMSSVITAFDRSGHWSEALQLFEGCSPTGQYPRVKPNRALYGALIEVLVNEGMLHHALEVYAKGVASGVYKAHVDQKDGLSMIGSVAWNTVLGKDSGVARSKPIIESAPANLGPSLDTIEHSCTLDLHGLSLAVAKVATCSTLCAFSSQYQGAKEEGQVSNLVLVTGIGRRLASVPKSAAAGPAVPQELSRQTPNKIQTNGLLQSEIRTFCNESFYPGLNPQFVSSSARSFKTTRENQGALTLKRKAIEKWIRSGSLIKGFKDTASLMDELKPRTAQFGRR